MKQGINFMSAARGSDPGILGVNKIQDTAPHPEMEEDEDYVWETTELSAGLRPYAANYDDSEAAGEPPYWATWGF
jgi:hypothetical protein